MRQVGDLWKFTNCEDFGMTEIYNTLQRGYALKGEIKRAESEQCAIRKDDAAPEPALTFWKREEQLAKQQLSECETVIKAYESSLTDSGTLNIISVSAKTRSAMPLTMQIVIKVGGKSYTRHLQLLNGAYYGWSLTKWFLVPYGTF